ncbi:hypothetical protein [Frederiksenia canicola]|uniref:Lipoprotein n=1 Tax=Frederiksenia canicola TaxID=123824 RepID=A0AAE6X7L3_9PAST|nr:hypothetical protein [Frederiksenia canicola]QIM64939.1 hypothetical protein A4G17_05590 [Frederiksenia canicola]RPE96656.1 hypothetical protein EDC49_1052 [Frederiksenia canicola]
MYNKALTLIISAFILSGCGNRILNPQFSFEYRNPALTQLIGKHISLVQERISLHKIDTSGLLYNYYYLYKDCDYMGDYITYNGYDVILKRQPIYHCGEIYFASDKDGIITNYIEKGYIPTKNYQTYFKDLIIIEN